MTRLFVILLLSLPLLPVGAQTPPNVTSRSASWLDEAMEVDIRLRGQPTASNPAGPLVRLISAQKFDPQNNAVIYNLTIPCWNVVSACPAVHGLTFQVFLRLPNGARQNVTPYSGRCGVESTCVVAWFPPIAAKPGDGYKFRYDSVKAVWVETPSVIRLLPDLIITSLSYSADGIFSSVVKNQGTATISAGVGIGVGYSVDGVYRTWGGSTSALSPGATVRIGSEGGAFVIAPGVHTISAWVDDAAHITELDETNNGLVQTITVGN